MWRGALSVFRFEVRRTMTVSRIAIWLMLILFPVFIVSVMKYHEEAIEEDIPKEVFDTPQMRVQRELAKAKSAQGDAKRTDEEVITDVVATLERDLAALKRAQSDADVPRDGKPAAEEVTTDDVARLERALAALKRAQGDADLPRDVKPAAQEAATDDAARLEQAMAGLKRAQSDADLPRDPDQSDEELAADEEAAEEEPPNSMDRLWGIVFFGLIPEVITLFGLLLWVPPLVHAELEGRTWIYLAVRPRGRVSVLLGKYLTAITWTALAGWISTTVCVLVARPECALRLWGTMVALVALACVAYGAIYSLIGVWLHRRAMVIAVAYTLIFEFLVSFIPAVINKFTVQYRLRNLLITWMDWWDWDLVSSGPTTLFMGNERAWVHILILCGIVVGILAIAVQVIQRREYATVADA